MHAGLAASHTLAQPRSRQQTEHSSCLSRPNLRPRVFARPQRVAAQTPHSQSSRLQISKEFYTLLGFLSRRHAGGHRSLADRC